MAKKVVTLSLSRTHPKPNYTIGDLWDGKIFLCNTLEDTVREMHDLNGDGDTKDVGEGKVYGRTAIAPGTYRILMYNSPHFKRELPWLQNVPSHDYALIHAGNKPEDTLGCILVGKNDKPGWISNSQATEKAVVARIKKYIADGYEVYITIK